MSLKESVNYFAGKIDLKPTKLETYEGRSYFLAENTLMYKVEQKLNLLQILNPSKLLSYSEKKHFESTYLVQTAAVWWLTLTEGNRFLDT